LCWGLRNGLDAAATQTEGKKLLLSAAVAHVPIYVKNAGYDVMTMNTVLDFVTVVAMNFHDNEVTKLRYSTPLFCKGPDDDMCIKKSLDVWLKKGLCPQKSLLGRKML